MKKSVFAIAGLLAILACLKASDVVHKGLIQIPLKQTVQAGSSQKVNADFGNIPLQFIPNRGQLDEQVSFYIQGRDKAIYFTPKGLTFVVAEQAKKKGDNLLKYSEVRNDAAQRWVVKLDFLGSNPNAIPVGLEETGGVISYFKGKPDEWKTGIPTYSKIIYRELWPGIDLIYCGTVNRMKYDFIIHPGASPSKIRLAYRGAENVALTSEGSLCIETPFGGFKDDLPLAYQESEGEKIAIPVSYALDIDADSQSSLKILKQEASNYVFWFNVGEYDCSRTLVIDPVMLVYCGYIGGSEHDTAHAIAIDSSKNAYITGITYSTDMTFPVLVGPDLTYSGGLHDAFIAKVNAFGTGLEYCGFIGGSGMDSASGIAIDDLGNAYVTGSTDSTEITFPVIGGPDLTHNGGTDAFVAKVNADGTGLIYCGYLGGSGYDSSLDIAIDNLGNAYITGQTNSVESDFPVILGPDLSYNGGVYDSFIAKVDSSGSFLSYCGYIGGIDDDRGRGVAVDLSGNAYVTGTTRSSETSFPVKTGPDLLYNGNQDAFIAKISSTGTEIIYCGYIGSNIDRDYGNGIAVDVMGNAYIAGHTFVPASDFPRVVGPDLTANGEHDAFVCKLNSSGSEFIYCGFIGGSGQDIAYGIDIDELGNAYVSGITSSTEASFPVTDGPGLTYNGGDWDVFIAKVMPSGMGLVYCGYIGGSEADMCLDIAIDREGGVYVVGETKSDETTFPVAEGPDITFNGDSDAFVAKIQDITGIAPEITTLDPSSASAGDSRFTLTVMGSGFYNGAVVRWDGADRPTTFVSSSEVYAIVESEDIADVKTVQVTVRNPGGGISNVLEFQIVNPVPSLTSLVPSTTFTGGSEFTLSVIGSHFIDGAVVRWDGQERPTSYLNSLQVDASIGVGDITVAKSVQITVRNPDGAVSNSLEFLIENPMPVLSNLSPSSITGGGAGFILTLLGSNFISNSITRWDGVDKVTNYINGTELRANILAADITEGKEVQIAVFNQSPVGGTSNIIIFPVSTFTLNSSPTNLIVTAGQTAAYAIQITPHFASFNSPVNLTCTGLPRNAIATITPTSVTPGSNTAAVALSISTRANSFTSLVLSSGSIGSILPALILILAIQVMMIHIILASKKQVLRWVSAVALVFMLGLLGSCGTKGDDGPTPNTGGTPPGTYQITVRGESGTITASTVVTLEVR